MDSTRINNMLSNIYIPADNTNKQEAIPKHHPSLIMQDKQTDTTHHMSCGCCNSGVCIANAWWNKKSSSSTSTMANNSGAPSQELRPSLQPMRSNSSVSTTYSYSSY